MNEDEVNHYLNMHKEGGVDNPKHASRMVSGPGPKS